MAKMSAMAHMLKSMVTQSDMDELKPWLGHPNVGNVLRDICKRRGLQQNIAVHSALIELTQYKLASTTASGQKNPQKEEIPSIDRTYDVILPSGRPGKVNIFDMNLAMAAGGESYVQLEDTGWIQAKRLKIIPKVKRNPSSNPRKFTWQLIAGRGSIGDINWGVAGRPLPVLKKELAELNKHIGERVLLTGGGGPGGNLATLKRAAIVKEGYMRGKPGLQVRLTNLDPKYGGFGGFGKEAFTPWMDSWQVSVKHYA